MLRFIQRWLAGGKGAGEAAGGARTRTSGASEEPPSAGDAVESLERVVERFESLVEALDREKYGRAAPAGATGHVSASLERALERLTSEGRRLAEIAERLDRLMGAIALPGQATYHGRGTVGASRQVNEITIRLDPRYILPALAFLVVLLVIIFVELCGTEGTPEPQQVVDDIQEETVPAGPTFTPGPSPTPGVETPTPAPEEPVIPPDAPGSPEERDTLRQEHLAVIEDALEEYRADEGEYPSTQGGMQTLCVFTEADVGCALQEVLDQIPEDPLGDAMRNGYFYRSDGENYTVFAVRESEEVPACPEHPEHLAGIDSLLCVSGP